MLKRIIKIIGFLILLMWALGLLFQQFVLPEIQELLDNAAAEIESYDEEEESEERKKENFIYDDYRTESDW